MSKFLKSGLGLAVAMAVSMALSSPVHANLLLDGFGDEQPIGGLVSDTTIDGVAESSGPVEIFDTDFTNVWRTITAELTGSASGSQVVSANVVGGVYEHVQSSGEDGYTRIDWTFDATSFNDPITLLTSVSFIDLTADLLFTLIDIGTNSATKTSHVASLGTNTHQFSGFDGLDMSNIVGASLEIRGATSLDMNLDFVEVPAPGVLGLLGIGLAGIAFAARRRRGIEVAAA